MSEQRLVRRVVSITAAQDRWLTAYEKREGLTNGSEAVRDILRRTMAGETLVVDGNRTDGHTEQVHEGAPA